MATKDDFDIDISDPPCSFHPILFKDSKGNETTVVAQPTANASASAGNAFSSAVDRDAARRCGDKLTRRDVVSLIFLLVNNVENALLLCRAVEEGRYPDPVGPTFMDSLVERARKKGLLRWDVKMACALHLIRKYRVRVY